MKKYSLLIVFLSFFSIPYLSSQETKSSYYPEYYFNVDPNQREFKFLGLERREGILPIPENTSGQELKNEQAYNAFLLRRLKYQITTIAANILGSGFF